MAADLARPRGGDPIDLQTSVNSGWDPGNQSGALTLFTAGTGPLSTTKRSRSVQASLPCAFQLSRSVQCKQQATQIAQVTIVLICLLLYGVVD